MDQHRINPGQNDETLLELLRAQGADIPALCAGRGTCGKCRVRVLEGSLAVTASDEKIFSDEQLAQGWRLACMAHPEEPLTVEPGSGGDAGFHAMDEFTGFGYATNAYTGSGPKWAIAADIGTTTLAFCLLDLEKGEVAGRYSAVNRQREYGADVISRIVYTNENGVATLRDSIRGQLSEGAMALCREQNLGPDDVATFAIAGNTTMLHLLLGLDCSTLGVFPFTPVTLARTSLPYSDLFTGGLNCNVDILPGISTYVGADIVSGILLCGMYSAQKPVLLVDIGTNGEMALAKDGKLICTSTAAGPAFEGGNIRWGTGSVPGAINTVVWNGEGFDVTTIGDAPPVGICGSGVLDAVHQSLVAGLVSKTGRMNKERAPAGEVELARTQKGEAICLMQKDVRELQLGKSATRSGIDLLMEHAGVGVDDIETLYLAGGFGTHLNPESAFGIGLLPSGLEEKTTAIGNSSLGGLVRLLLEPGASEELGGIIGKASEFNLAQHPEFNNRFMGNTAFK